MSGLREGAPKRYVFLGKEVLDHMAKMQGDLAVANFLECSAIKYRLRAGKKDKTQSGILRDIEKAIDCEEKALELRNRIKETIL